MESYGIVPRSLVLMAFGRKGVVVGGPFGDRLHGFFGIKLAPEVPTEADVTIPIPDFGLAADTKSYVRHAEDAVVRVLSGERVYVGCLMGRGRTGTFLAVMAKMCGEGEPVAFVRRWYLPVAVETKAQEGFVADLPVGWSRVRIGARLLWRRIRG